MDTKVWYQSTTIQGLIVEVVLLIINVFKINILKDEVQVIVTAIFGIIGAVMVIIGRQKATQPLGWYKK